MSERDHKRARYDERDDRDRRDRGERARRERELDPKPSHVSPKRRWRHLEIVRTKKRK